jgi:3-isopropylmalate/(R)-2-methylmalate dehydratase large subunit
LGRTLAEKILSAKSGTNARVGDIVLCQSDLVLGTDGSTPMAIDLFEQMGGCSVLYPERVILSRDHYAPPTSEVTSAYHARMETFASTQGVELLPVGEGIGFQVALETGRVHPGQLIVGADSHTVTCGAAGAFATGIGSTDLAAVFLTGNVWLRVPKTIRVLLEGRPTRGVGVKDIGLEVVRTLGSERATYSALEFIGPVADALPIEGRLVISNMSVETGAKTGVFPAPDWSSDETAKFAAELRIDCSLLEPLVALPHEPANGVSVSEMLGTAVDWVFLGTCSGGCADDFREALAVLEAGGGISDGLTVVATPPTTHVRAALEGDGSLDRLKALGATVTETGCGPCCGTSVPVPPPNARILSTANRNFRGRMGQASATIHLASPITCAAAATAGCIVDPRELL